MFLHHTDIIFSVQDNCTTVNYKYYTVLNKPSCGSGSLRLLDSDK